MLRFAQSALTHACNPFEFVFYVDRDDDSTRAAKRSVMFWVGKFCEVKWVVGDRVILSEAWNRCAEHAEGDILGHMGDDIVIRTVCWDLPVMGAFEDYPDRIAFVHGRDGIHDDRLGTHGFVSREWYETVGHFVPPYFSHDYNDLWLTEVADAIGRRVYLPDLYTEHLHPSVDKAEDDQTYRDHVEAGRRDAVDTLYRQLWREREHDVEKLRRAIHAHSSNRPGEARAAGSVST